MLLEFLGDICILGLSDPSLAMVILTFRAPFWFGAHLAIFNAFHMTPLAHRLRLYDQTLLRCKQYQEAMLSGSP